MICGYAHTHTHPHTHTSTYFLHVFPPVACILTAILFDIDSNIYSDIPSVVLSHLYSGNLSDIYSGILSGRHSTWHLFYSEPFLSGIVFGNRTGIRLVGLTPTLVGHCDPEKGWHGYWSSHLGVPLWTYKILSFLAVDGGHIIYSRLARVLQDW